MYCRSVKPRMIATVKPEKDEHFSHIKILQSNVKTEVNLAAQFRS